jgi:hypothetical protein
MSYYDLQELACAILGLDYDKLVDNGEEDEIDNALYDKFEISMEQFCDLVKALLPLTMPLQSPLTKEWHYCFGKEEDGLWRAIIKMKATVKTDDKED